MPKLVTEVEAFFDKAVATVEAELEKDWAELKPAIVALGKTVEGQVLQAATTLVMNPTSVGFAEALASIVGQIPGDAKILETAVAGMLAAKVAGLKAQPAAQ